MRLHFDGLLKGLRRRRKAAEFGNQLAGAMDFLAGSLRSGSSLAQGLQALALESKEPAASLFGQVAQQCALGAQPEAALDELAGEMSPSACEEELRMLATAVGITRSSGGNLAEILAGLADTLRERQRLRAEIGTMTAQGRMSGWIVGALPAVILAALSVMDPGLVAPLFNTPTGMGLLALGVVLEILGALTIRRIVRIEA